MVGIVGALIALTVVIVLGSVAGSFQVPRVNQGADVEETTAPAPSHADIRMARARPSDRTPPGISVHDHIIVGRNGHASLRGLKLIQPSMVD